MQKKKAAKLGGFIGALCVSGALVGMGVSGTGAYFSDSHDGVINAYTGHVRVSTSDTTLNFTNLMPGQDKTQPITYTADTTGAEDVWLVFPNDSSSAFLTDDSNKDGLGRYGHFALSAPSGSFESYNLRADQSGDAAAAAADSCGVDQYGHGGSNAQVNSLNDPPQKYCAVPHAILLGSNLTNGQTQTASIAFGFTKFYKGPQDGGVQIAKYKIVATQPGVSPLDENN